MRRAVAIVSMASALVVTGSFTAEGPPRKCLGRVVTIIGSPEDDVLIGTAMRDVIWGNRGRDSIFGLSGDDHLCGGVGRDNIEGGPDFDEAQGGKGRDVCSAEVRKSCRPPADGGR